MMNAQTKDNDVTFRVFDVDRIAQKFNEPARRQAYEGRDKLKIPETEEDDAVERDVRAEAAHAINGTTQKHLKNVETANSDQQNISIEIGRAEQAVNAFKVRTNAKYDDYRENHADLRSEDKRVENDINALKQKTSTTRNPKPNNMTDTAMGALGFGAVESFASAIVFLVFGAAFFFAISVAIGVSALHIGLGGFAMSSLTRLSLKANTGQWSWLYRALLGAVFLIIVIANYLLFVNRGELKPIGSEFDSNTDAQLIVALLLLAFNLFVWIFWFQKFWNAADPLIEFGRLGEKQARIRAALRIPARKLREYLLKEGKKLDEELSKIGQETAHKASKSSQVTSKIQNERNRYHSNAELLVSAYEQVTERLRQTRSEILLDLTPAYFGKEPDYAHLITPFSVEDQSQDLAQHHQSAHDQVQENIKNARKAKTEHLDQMMEKIKSELGGE